MKEDNIYIAQSFNSNDELDFQKAHEIEIRFDGYKILGGDNYVMDGLLFLFNGIAWTRKGKTNFYVNWRIGIMILVEAISEVIKKYK